MKQSLIILTMAISLITGAQDTTFHIRVNPSTDTTDVFVTTRTVVTPTKVVTNLLPAANAGQDVVLTLPMNLTQLNGTASSDPDGTIKLYAWTFVSGPGTYLISGTGLAVASVSNLVAGTYVFRLTVLDDKGGSASDNVSIFVNPATQPPPNIRQNLILDANFDGANVFTGFTTANGQFCCSYSITQSVSPDAGLSIKSLKFDLRSTDAIVSSSKRAEIQLAGTDAPETSERWYGLRYWLEKYDADGGAESLLQWHDVDGTTPPLSLQVQSGRMRIMQSFTSGNIPYDLGPTDMGKWINIVIHVKWTTGTNGLLEVWRDGTKIVNKQGVRTNSKGGSYMKIGINKWSWAPGGGSSTATQRVFYIDNFRMGNELAVFGDVAP